MRTDSTRIADSAIAEVRDFIAAQYGANRLPAKPNQYKNKKGAQDAHEPFVRHRSGARPKRLPLTLRLMNWLCTG